jgi:hypothetical protein
MRVRSDVFDSQHGVRSVPRVRGNQVGRQHTAVVDHANEARHHHQHADQVRHDPVRSRRRVGCQDGYPTGPVHGIFGSRQWHHCSRQDGLLGQPSARQGQLQRAARQHGPGAPQLVALALHKEKHTCLCVGKARRCMRHARTMHSCYTREGTCASGR